VISHYRIDSRVVHGQTTTRIVKEHPVDGVIIVDDGISNDGFIQKIYANALGSIRMLCFTVEKAARKLPEAEASKKSYLIIFKTTESARQLAEVGYRFKGVLNVGPQPNCEGAQLVEKMLYLTDEQIADLDYLESVGTSMIVNPAFTTPNLSWSAAKSKMGAR
jgi:PTS system mannose-specific IIB component